MSEGEVEEIKTNIYNSLLKNKPKEMCSDDQGNKNKRVVFQEKPIILNKIPPKTSETLSKPDSGDSEKIKERKERSRPPTKVVVRRLPPSMSLETFVDNVSPLPEHDFIYFVRADMSLGPNAFSRAYINFVNMDDLLTFYEQFDNYVFMDNKGNEYPAVVEFAPFQRVPKKRPGRKKDPKVGTLKDDPAFISFVASLNEKKDTSSMKQASADHLLALTSESPSKKDVSTPLLEFIKVRRAERQRVREEKREERKRKELERKRIKEEERKRRKDGDSVLKVLRNPEHEEKDDTGRNMRERDRNQQLLKKRDEERKHREKERKERRDIRGRDGRDGLPKPFRDDRPKQIDNRVPRKDDPHKKLGGDRYQIQSKTMDIKYGDYEKSHGKESETYKQQIGSKDTDMKRGINEKFPFYSKENDKYSRDMGIRKSYKDNDLRRSEKAQGYVKDMEYRRGSYGNDSRRIGHSYSESDARKKNFDRDRRSNFRSGDNISEMKLESHKSQITDESDGKKWELLGAKPKRKYFERDDSIVKESENDGKSVNEICESPERQHSENEEENDEDENLVKATDNENISTEVHGILIKRRSSLESDIHNERKVSDRFGSEKPKRQTSLDSEVFVKDVCVSKKEKNVLLSKSQEFVKSSEHLVKIQRRNSLDSNDFKRESSIEEDQKDSESSSTSKQGAAEDKDGTIEIQIDEKEEMSRTEKKQQTEKTDGNIIEISKKEENKSSDGSSAEGSKRDPRAERRIRNKDRPSIEIYRPGMGRFSMQRKEREKNCVIGSSTEQDSPSNSPSPSPSTRLMNSAKGPKTSQELRSMTFKRSVSREK